MDVAGEFSEEFREFQETPRRGSRDFTGACFRALSESILEGKFSYQDSAWLVVHGPIKYGTSGELPGTHTRNIYQTENKSPEYIFEAETLVDKYILTFKTLIPVHDRFQKSHDTMFCQMNATHEGFYFKMPHILRYNHHSYERDLDSRANTE